MPFEIIRNDITLVRADAIVNTANPHPIVGAGTDSAIHRAAGEKLLAARERIGEIAVGESVATPAFSLPAKYVLHTVSPVWEGGGCGEEALLRKAYDAALALADRLHCRSVAFPLLSAGSYGFPKEIALSTAIAAFTDFLLTHDMRVILVTFEQGTAALAGGLFGELKSYIDDRYVDEATIAEYGLETRRPARRMEAAKARRNAKPARPQQATIQWYTPYEPESIACDEAAGASSDLDRFLKRTESTFSEHLRDLLNECGEKDADVYRRAEVSRQLFHKIISNKDYQPTKSTAIQLALGLRLNLSQTQKLLEKAGYALTRSSKADLVVQYFIVHGNYSIVAVNTALYDCGLPLLKTGTAL